MTTKFKSYEESMYDLDPSMDQGEYQEYLDQLARDERMFNMSESYSDFYPHSDSLDY